MRYDFVMFLERSMSKILVKNLRGILHEITRFRSMYICHHISVNTCAIIGQLSRPYFTVRLAKFKS